MVDSFHRYDKAHYLEVVDDTRIKHNDVFNMKNLYTLTHEWLMDRGYVQSKSDPAWPETLYMHRFRPEKGDEIWIWWRFKKRFNSFVQFDLDVDCHCIGIKSTEIIHNGEKIKANKGEPEFKIYGKLIVDPDGEWQKNWFTKSIFEVFWRRIYISDYYDTKREMVREVYRFKEAIKSYFNLQTYLPEPENEHILPDENEEFKV